MCHVPFIPCRPVAPVQETWEELKERLERGLSLR
jgi:hypothetical protein